MSMNLPEDCRLTVIEQIDDYIAPSGGKHKRFLCRCSCGNTVVAFKEHLTSGRQKSCGCLRKENGITKHGQSNTRLYKIWANMKTRCFNENVNAWRNYGSRGIGMCDEWLEFSPFYEWAMHSGYQYGLTIDRIDNNGGYSPENCRWVDDIEQNNNKRNNHIVEYNGKSQTVAEWAREFEIPYKVLHHRLALGWNVERALTQKVRKSPQSSVPNTKDGQE